MTGPVDWSVLYMIAGAVVFACGAGWWLRSQISFVRRTAALQIATIKTQNVQDLMSTRHLLRNEIHIAVTDAQEAIEKSVGKDIAGIRRELEQLRARVDRAFSR